MARKGIKKDTYWHNIAKLALSNGLKPAQVGRLIKEVFPETEVNGRHIGAYKRRMIQDGAIIPDKMTMSINDMVIMATDLVSKEDRFVYDCTIGSQIQSLKCFEYKLTAEEKDELDEVERWISRIKKR